MNINKNCGYYNLGGNGTTDRPMYPKTYGARCEFYKEFFGENGPKCEGCRESTTGEPSGIEKEILTDIIKEKNFDLLDSIKLDGDE